MVADIIHVCNLSILFSSSAFLHLYYRYRLAMDESKSELNVRCCAECTVVRYIFRLLYGDQGRYGSRHHSFMRPLNLFSSSIFLHSCYRYRLTMDESKSETNVRCCIECSVVHYISVQCLGKNSV
jgi:hypothetical protein